jgi:hypothetical protein
MKIFSSITLSNTTLAYKNSQVIQFQLPLSTKMSNKQYKKVQTFQKPIKTTTIGITSNAKTTLSDQNVTYFYVNPTIHILRAHITVTKTHVST